MDYRLFTQRFSPSLLDAVRDFHCGSDPWEVEVAQWIKEPEADDCAVAWMRCGTEVWLYRTDDGQVVGYGSLGTSMWRMQHSAPREPVCIIPAFAVASRFKGEPRSRPPEQRYAAQIMGDLIAKAASLGPRILGLFVDKRNARAIAFYRRLGFQSIPDDGGQYMRMFLDLK